MSDSEEENYVTFGVALEPLDEENLPRKKAVTIEDQYAYDAQGRRRFHGAFTGGFSAGYFNTVGTRDGWKPQQFKSSRASKAKAIEQQPEDFMDEEDVSIFGIAPKGIRANSDYEHHGQKGTKRGRAEAISNQSMSYNPVLKELLRPVKETVGILLLKKMGWKPGQGIGNRVTKKEKIKAKQQIEKIKVYGCSLPNSKDMDTDDHMDDSDDEISEITFAPDDYEPFKFKGKDNYFGIGYSGLNRQTVLSSQNNTEPKYESSNKSLPIFGHAFGVGAFEADDDDIYEKDDMSRYDSVLGPERKSKTRWSKEDSSNKKDSNCIDGFVPATDKLNNRKIFAPPHLPKDYRAVHFVRKSRFFPPIPRESINEKKKILNVTDRSRILSDVDITHKTIQRQSDTSGEVLASNNSVPISNLVLESSKSLEYQNVEDGKDLGISKMPTSNSWVDKLSAKSFVSGGVTGSEPIVPGLSSKLANSNNSTLIDTSLKDKHKVEEIKSVQSINKGEKDQKFVEFEQGIKLTEEVEANDTNIQKSDNCATNIIHDVEKEKEEAAKMEMFGKLTREVIDWQPASIVCKRFNVPEPKNTYAQFKPEKKHRFSVFDSLDMDASSRFLKATDTVSKNSENETSATSHKDETIENHPSTSLAQVKNSFDNKESEIVSEKMKNFEASYEKIFGKTVYEKSEEKQEEKVEKTKNETASIKNAEEKKDLFRAIFLSSSEESESEPEENIDNEIVKSVLIGDNSYEINTARNMSPPRGIFAKLDLDDLVSNVGNNDMASIKDSIKPKVTNSPTRSEPQTTIEKDVESKTSDTLQASIQSEIYGPMLPSRLIKDGNASTGSVGSTEISKPIYKSVVIPKVAEKLEGKWVELHKTKKSKKVKKKHKHKEHKSSKSKKKSKKHKH